MLIRKKATVALILGLVALAVSLFVIANQSSVPPQAEEEIKSQEIQVLDKNPDTALSLNASEQEKTIESAPIKAEFQFNAIAPHWKEENASEENRKMEFRTSLDSESWGPWLEIEAVGPLREDEPHPDRMYPEVPLLMDGRYFQYRISLSRPTLQDPSPQVYDLKVSQIDSRRPFDDRAVSLLDRLRGLFKTETVHAAQQHPRVINRSEWGSPDPHGDYFKGTDRYWPTRHKPVTQIFIHHTVTTNYQADPSAAVRAIWDFHANTRGWGDIGYNYLLDHHGNVYQGRLGGDNAVGGHVLRYNKGSLGVALLGCFDSTNKTCLQLNGGAAGPNQAVFDGLTSLLSNKATSFGIDPWGSNLFCDINDQNCLNLPTITGHRDAQLTTCPGDLTVEKLQEIRNSTKAKNDEGWTYSARQLDFDSVDLSSAQSANVTLRFRNTGRTTWSNSVNRLSLYTMEPPERSSIFEGTGWLSSYQPAALTEGSVMPGGTGSFTFNVKRPNMPPGDYFERYTLITANGSTPGAHFTLPIALKCTIGQASNPRPNGVLVIEAGTPTIYLVDNGKKRHIVTPLAALTNGLNLNYAHPVSSAEIALLENGASVNVKEGTLLKTNSSPSVYIIDDTTTGQVKRHISSASAMDAFGLKSSQIHTAAQAVLDSYGNGPDLSISSAIPDGRLIKTDASPTVYLVQSGERRRISSLLVFNSYGFTEGDVNIVAEDRVNQLASGSSFSLLRSGSMFKSPTSSTVYGVDTDAGTAVKYPITTPYALTAAGYRFENLFTVPDSLIEAYTSGASIKCYEG